MIIYDNYGNNQSNALREESTIGGRMKEKIYLALLMVVLIFPLGCATTSNVKESLEVPEVPAIKGIDIQNYAVTVTVNKPFNYIIRSSDPHKVVVELPDVSIGAFNNKIVSNKAGITEIVPSQIESPSLIARLEMFIQTPSMVNPEHKGNVLVLRIKNLQPDSPVSSDVSDSNGYVIGDEDVLRISVWGNPDLTVEIPVRPDGMISVPLVGDVRAAGLKPEELKTLLETDLKKYIKEPTVSVVVTAVNSFKVFVLGEGVSGAATTGTTAAGATPSGAVTLRRNTTLLQLLAQLGSLQNVDLNNSYILRNGQKLNVDFYKLVAKGNVSQDIRLKPNDIIFLPDNFDKRIKVVGAVKNPGIIQYTEGITALDAILSAGGFTEFANQNNVIVVRKEGNEVKNIEVNLKDVINGDIDKNLLLKPGDLVTVKTGIF
jgi:polysaccharide export outer membrane protein